MRDSRVSTARRRHSARRPATPPLLVAKFRLVERWNGTRWVVDATSLPSGASAGGLSGVSCSAVATCTAVGNYRNQIGNVVTLAEREG